MLTMLFQEKHRLLVDLYRDFRITQNTRSSAKIAVQLAVACTQTQFSNFREIPGRNFGLFEPILLSYCSRGLEITLLVLVSCGAIKRDGRENKDCPSLPWQSLLQIWNYIIVTSRDHIFMFGLLCQTYQFISSKQFFQWSFKASCLLWQTHQHFVQWKDPPY